MTRSVTLLMVKLGTRRIENLPLTEQGMTVFDPVAAVIVSSSTPANIEELNKSLHCKSQEMKMRILTESTLNTV